MAAPARPDGGADAGAVKLADVVRLQCQPEGKVKTHAQVERANQRNRRHAPPQRGMPEGVQPQRRPGGSELSGRERDMAQFKLHAKKAGERRNQAEHEAERDVGGEP